MTNNIDRRKVVKIIAIGGALATISLPSKWTKPVIQSVFVPAHAQASLPPGLLTTTAAPTTAAPTTTSGG